ncbi:peptidase G1 domain-containing protein [Phanerochaete sordida]|uniref:Peptidase G1 domain-containing protein n=1 Tax=Phanerochaete sordida TaxID=48140 RepID=A0A9P3GKB7_9APHY|nr:peptidase G1 domain-containing protein [Phanerochaete sordida]
MLRILAAVLAAAAVLARPADQARLRAPIATGTPDTHVAHSNTSNDRPTRYSANWAGAVLHSPVDELREITGTFTVPAVRWPQDEGHWSSQWGKIWIGIGSDLCGDKGANIRVGVEIIMQSSGEIDVLPFYQAYPNPFTFIGGNYFSSGDDLVLSISLDSKTSGRVTVKAPAYRIEIRESFATGPWLCPHDAEWVVEANIEDGEIVTPPDFGAIVFKDAHAAGVGPDAAHAIDMFQQRQLTEVSVGPSTVNVTYLPDFFTERGRTGARAQ